ncbi:unnamed protein product [Rotaria magnacalcarata]|uniref:Uncharacterized protein n=1 Tax=Rotaria magnacalcarata TaxID=392030 RepID=A0A814YLC6_9BILA|nr:unnamed protein product [Rotaria magnacalcarata]CAF1596251.1 unnamed protein product [Rotaria magnacalcarata]CAF2067948.1 unnamed protein product [Rotaria magnacalcarata]CAF2090533.1 unnamed protein product [Rotaria magnacalcarata]CAF2110568.1 unnamed protein product [Rotaria magnacalcarata]
MACNISKHLYGSAYFSGSLAKSVLLSGLSAIDFTGSGLFVNTRTIHNGNAASENSPILKSDISEQF